MKMSIFKKKAQAAPVPDETGKIMSFRTFNTINSVQWFITLLFVILLVLSNFVFFNVPTLSMYPTMNAGTYALSSRDVSKIQRGDIVIFFPNAERSSRPGLLGAVDDLHQKSERYIKRCMGMPGDTLAVHDGKLYINGVAQDEPYLYEQYITYSMSEITLAEDEYFMLGDNRNMSGDSHIIGPVKESHLSARVLCFIKSPFSFGVSK